MRFYESSKIEVLTRNEVAKELEHSAYDSYSGRGSQENPADLTNRTFDQGSTQ
jgi:hypothetical protein